MQTSTDKTEIKVKYSSHKRRLDFYWQYIAVYAIAVIIYALLRGTISEWKFTIVLRDPVVILLTIFILVTTFSLIIEYFKKHEITVGRDFIQIKKGNKEKKFTQKDILKISLVKEKVRKFKRPYRIIKIKVLNRKRSIRFRPIAFWNEKELIQSVVALKKNISR